MHIHDHPEAKQLVVKVEIGQIFMLRIVTGYHAVKAGENMGGPIFKKKYISGLRD